MCLADQIGEMSGTHFSNVCKTPLINFGWNWKEKQAHYLNQHVEFSEQVSTFKVQLHQEPSEIRLCNCSHKWLKGHRLSRRQSLRLHSRWSLAQRGNTQNANISEEFPPMWGERCSLTAGWVRNGSHTNVSSGWLIWGLPPLILEHGNRIIAGAPGRLSAVNLVIGVTCLNVFNQNQVGVAGPTFSPSGAIIGTYPVEALDWCASQDHFCSKWKRTQLKLPAGRNENLPYSHTWKVQA